MALSAQKHLRHLKSLSEVSTVGGQDHHNVDRFKAALEKRRELLRMRTNDMPTDWVDQIGEAERIICAAVSVAANRVNYH